MDLSKREVKAVSMEFLQFLLPGYEIKSYVTALDEGKKVIFTGPCSEKNREKLSSYLEDYVIASGRPDVDLTSRRGILMFVYKKFEKEVPKYFDDIIDLYDDDEFMYCVKVLWVSGKWPYKVENEVSMYDMFDSTIDSVITMLNKAVVVMEQYPDYV